MGARETNIVEAAGQLILPKSGGWVVIKGNPWASRGNRIIQAHRDEGIKHFDIYWAYDEECPWHLAESLIRDYRDDPEYLAESIADLNQISAMLQLTWMTLHTPSSQLIRVWCGEVFKTTEETIAILLQEDGLETISFGGKNIIWSEETRDIVGSMMLDGLSLAQAQHELLTARAIKKKELVKPNWFYRPIGFLREQFSEEPEYEAWYAPEENKVNA